MSKGRPALKLGEIGSDELNSFLAAKYHDGNGGGGGGHGEKKEKNEIIDVNKEKLTRAQEFYDEARHYLATLLGGHKLFTADNRPSIGRNESIKKPEAEEDEQLNDVSGTEAEAAPTLSSTDQDHHKIAVAIMERVLKMVADDFGNIQQSKLTAYILQKNSQEYLEKEWSKNYSGDPTKEVEECLDEAIDFAFDKLVPVHESKLQSLPIKPHDVKKLRQSPEYKKLAQEFFSNISRDVRDKFSTEQAAKQLMWKIFGKPPKPDEVDVFLKDIEELAKSGEIYKTDKKVDIKDINTELANIRQSLSQENEYLLNTGEAPPLKVKEIKIDKPLVVVESIVPTTPVDQPEIISKTTPPEYHSDGYGHEFTRELNEQEMKWMRRLQQAALDYFEKDKERWMSIHCVGSSLEEKEQSFQEYVQESLRIGYLFSAYQKIGLPVKE